MGSLLPLLLPLPLRLPVATGRPAGISLGSEVL